MWFSLANSILLQSSCHVKEEEKSMHTTTEMFRENSEFGKLAENYSRKLELIKLYDKNWNEN